MVLAITDINEFKAVLGINLFAREVLGENYNFYVRLYFL